MISLRQVTYGLLHLLYPSLCEGCSRPLIHGEHTICLECSLQLAITDYHAHPDNDTALRLAGRFPFLYATSYAYFHDDGLLQHLLHRLKYAGKKEIGQYLGSQLGYALANTNWISTVDALVPVPLHAAKQAARGFNQTAVIAAGMSAVLKIPVADALKRTRNTESQTHKTRSQRVDNMTSAFSVKNVSAIANKHVLLLDDVLTTGATLEAAAIALLATPAVRVSIATIGIAM